MGNNKITYLVKTIIELQAMVPTKSITQTGESGLREVTITQNTEFGLEKHFEKGRIDFSKIDITFGFGRLTLKKSDLQEALKRAK